MAKRKPWRNFKEKRLRDKHIRWVCLVIFAVEMGVLGKQGRLRLPVIKVTENREVVIYQLPLEGGDKEREGEPLEVPSKDQVYGIRIRLKDGMVDFYRREELHDGKQ